MFNNPDFLGYGEQLIRAKASDTQARNSRPFGKCKNRPVDYWATSHRNFHAETKIRHV